MLFYRRNPKEFSFIVLFVCLKITLHFFANSNFGFHRDEFLYMALGEHLDWGFQEVPPFIAGISWFSTSIFGESVFAARVISTFFGALIVFLTGLIVLALNGKRLAIAIACMAVIISPAFLASGYLLQPVVFDQFFWVLAAYLLVRYIRTYENQYVYALGFTAGIGMLNKYSMAFYILALLIALLLTPQRKILLNKAWLGAGAIAFVIFLPNLLWQINRDFPVLRHMNELKETQLNFINPVDFVLQQLMVHATASIVWITGFLYLFFSRPLRQFRFLAVSYLVVIILLIVLQGKSYYSFGAYPALFAVGGMAISRLTSRLSNTLKYSTVALILLPSIIFLPIAIPILPFHSTLKFFQFTSNQMNLTFPLKWEDQQLHATTQDYADMLGWEELSIEVSKTYRLIPENERTLTTIFANNYGQAGALDHYRKKYAFPATVCLSSSYALWAPEKITTQHLIYIDDEYPDDLEHAFKTVRKISEIKNPYAREKGTSVYLLSYPIESILPIYQQHRLEALN